ncbi:hypothetical protein [Pseudomonas flexibilis]|uniref:hypothetical protein n=1 Tax=Pseudomonas flexibilis TaxID=706570 RepID=UPI0011156894|nr:hypothetical protein [Pseudomonas flexibilis]
MFKDRSGIFFAVGVWGYVALGCVLGLVVSPLLGSDDLDSIAGIVSALSALTVSVCAMCALGDWKRSLQYGRRLDHVQKVKLLVMRLQDEIQAYLSWQSRRTKVQASLESVKAIGGVAVGYFKAEAKEIDLSIVEVRKNIELTLAEYKAAFELVKPLLTDRESNSIAHGRVSGIWLNISNEITKCKDPGDFWAFNKEAVVAPLDDVQKDIDALL